MPFCTRWLLGRSHRRSTHGCPPHHTGRSPSWRIQAQAFTAAGHGPIQLHHTPICAGSTYDIGVSIQRSVFRTVDSCHLMVVVRSVRGHMCHIGHVCPVSHLSCRTTPGPIPLMPPPPFHPPPPVRSARSDAHSCCRYATDRRCHHHMDSSWPDAVVAGSPAVVAVPCVLLFICITR